MTGKDDTTNVFVPLEMESSPVVTEPEVIAPDLSATRLAKQACVPPCVPESDAVKIARINAERDVVKHKLTVGGCVAAIILFFSKEWWSKRDLEYSHKDKDGSSRSLSLKTPRKGDKEDPPDEPKS